MVGYYQLRLFKTSASITVRTYSVGIYKSPDLLRKYSLGAPGGKYAYASGFLSRRITGLFENTQLTSRRSLGCCAISKT